MRGDLAPWHGGPAHPHVHCLCTGPARSVRLPCSRCMRHECSAAQPRRSRVGPLADDWLAGLPGAGQQGGIWTSWGSRGWSLDCSPHHRGFPGRESSAGTSLATHSPLSCSPWCSGWVSRFPVVMALCAGPSHMGSPGEHGRRLPSAGGQGRALAGGQWARWWCASCSHPSPSPRALLALHPFSVVRGPSLLLALLSRSCRPSTHAVLSGTR